jgi:hypothetical protein
MQLQLIQFCGAWRFIVILFILILSMLNYKNAKMLVKWKIHVMYTKKSVNLLESKMRQIFLE